MLSRRTSIEVFRICYTADCATILSRKEEIDYCHDEAGKGHPDR